MSAYHYVHFLEKFSTLFCLFIFLFSYCMECTDFNRTWQVFLPLYLVKRPSSEIYLWPLLPQSAKDQAIHRTKVSQALRKEKAQIVKDHATSLRFTNFCLCSTTVNSSSINYGSTDSLGGFIALVQP